MHNITANSAPVIFLATYGPHVLEPLLDAAVDEYQEIARKSIMRIENLEEDRILELVLYDPLTGLANRRLFQDRLKQAVLATRKQRSHSALLILDMDNFNTLNDTQGHHYWRRSVDRCRQPAQAECARDGYHSPPGGR